MSRVHAKGAQFLAAKRMLVADAEDADDPMIGREAILVRLDTGGLVPAEIVLDFAAARQLLIGLTDALDADGPHVEGPVECRVCTHRWRAVSPLAHDPAGLECPHCGAMAGERISDEG